VLYAINSRMVSGRNITRPPTLTRAITGMVPQTMSEKARSALLDLSIMVPPLLWLVSLEADGMTGRRLVATKWRTGSDGKSAAEAATEQAGW
jgi:hypothetical protein